MKITRRVEFDSGHRIPNHESKCRNVHGHRYVLEATVTGPLISEKGTSSEGMVIDFGSLKSIMTQYVAEPWDHAFLAWEDDPLCQVIKAFSGKVVELPAVPTVENLARIAFRRLVTPLRDKGLTLNQVRLYETPNCWADYDGALTNEE